jgi:hypothetical protein
MTLDPNKLDTNLSSAKNDCQQLLLGSGVIELCVIQSPTRIIDDMG